MIYNVRIPGNPQPQPMEFGQLKNAYSDGNIPGSALVTMEHQGFWYPLAEVMGDEPTKPLLFACPNCKHMIRSRAIDRGNPIGCPKCQYRGMVPNPTVHQALAVAATEKNRGKPLLWLGLVTFVIGAGMVAWQNLATNPGGFHGFVSYGITLLGIAMMGGTKIGPGGMSSQ